MDLTQLRSQIDEIDDEIVKLFCRRMDVAAQVADYKKANHLPIFMPGREREKLQDVAEKAGAKNLVLSHLVPGNTMLPRAHEAFTARGKLRDPRTAEAVKKLAGAGAPAGSR